jgi:hypothetical protein
MFITYQKHALKNQFKILINKKSIQKTYIFQYYLTFK